MATATAPAAPTRQHPTQRVLDALTDHGPLENGKPWDEQLTPEQRDRALCCPVGLTGKAAVTYVLEGDRPADSIAKARAAGKTRKPAAAAKTTTASKASKAAKARTPKPASKAASRPAATKPNTEPTTATSAATTPAKMPREGSGLHAAITILKDATEPLTPQQIYDLAVKRGLAGGLKGKTPVATLAAQMAVANKKGLYVERTAPGRYQLRRTGGR